MCYGPLKIMGVVGISGHRIDFTSWYYHFNIVQRATLTSIPLSMVVVVVVVVARSSVLMCTVGLLYYLK